MLFGIGKTKTGVVKSQPRPVQPPKAHQVAVDGNQEEVATHVALCQKIEAETPAVRMLQLRHFMAERGIPEYDYDEVRDHLNSLCQSEAINKRLRYYWFPLRESDRNVDFRWSWDDEYCGRSTMEDVYHKLVPGSVLQTAATILEKFPDAKFFVSDISGVDDPFFGVTFPGQVLVVVDFWDEPSFRPTK